MGIPTLSQVENTESGSGGIQIAKGLELKDLSRPRNEMDSPTSHYRNATDMTMMSSGKSQSRSPPAQFKRAQSVYDIQSSQNEWMKDEHTDYYSSKKMEKKRKKRISVYIFAAFLSEQILMIL